MTRGRAGWGMSAGLNVGVELCQLAQPSRAGFEPLAPMVPYLQTRGWCECAHRLKLSNCKRAEIIQSGVVSSSSGYGVVGPASN